MTDVSPELHVHCVACVDVSPELHVHCVACVDVSPELHVHCVACVDARCAAVACPVEVCQQACGAVLHACKQADHGEVCRAALVSCSNRAAGCPRRLRRADMWRHLPVCPASVTVCGAEWSRWPVYSSERRVRVPFHQNVWRAHAAQLDVALALRDQAALAAADAAPRTTLRVLRTPLSPRFPAVPLSGAGDADAPWVTCRNPPGLRSSVCNELFGPSKDAVNDADDDDDDDDSALGPESAPAPSVDTPPEAPAVLLHQMLSLDLNMEFISRYNNKPRSVYTFRCAQLFRRDEFAAHFRNVHVDIHSNLNNGWLEHRCPLASYGCTHSVQRLYPTHPAATVVYNTTLNCFSVRPHVDPCLLERGVKTRPREMEGTPDIYTSHRYESAVETNGTLRPRESSATVPPSTYDGRLHTGHAGTCLEDLPYELLLCVCRRLDSCGLASLSMCSHLLRDVCSCLLESRGIVVDHWERVEVAGCVRWKLARRGWQFSVGFTPVDAWGFRTNANMADHLRACPFNDWRDTAASRQRQELMWLGGMAPPYPPSKPFWPAMGRMYPHIRFDTAYRHNLQLDLAE